MGKSMKKYLLTAAAASVMLANTSMAGDVTVYGKANVSLQMVEEETTGSVDETTKDNWELQSNASRIGVKGDHEINEGLKAIYNFEYETSVDDGDKDGQTFTQRNIIVGLTGNWGTLMAGMHDTPVKMLGKPVDIFSDLTLGDIKDVVEGENRDKNMVMYRSPSMAGVKVDFMFSPGEDKGGDAGTSDDQDGPADQISAVVNYTSDFGLSVGIGVDSELDNRDLTRFVVAYGAESWGASLLVQSAEEIDSAGTEEEKGVIATVHGKFGSWQPKLLVGQATIEEDGADDIDVTQITAGVDYKLGKKTMVFGYYGMVEEETDNAASDTEKGTTVGIGLEHKF